ncbi:MAG: LD-carboxypeptidase, partial [Oscillospiraceae bacterium]|nr:LD-carboxypeptidase [Oscillospiraceae bacterium]
MIKPERIRPGDRVAVVSPSSGILGEPQFLHKFELAKTRLERDYGLELVSMPNTLKGQEYLYAHPEARAQDLMDAFLDPSIHAVFSAIGGEDAVRLLP